MSMRFCMKVKIVLFLFLMISLNLFGSGNMTIETFPAGITGWSGLGWNASGNISDETSIIYEGTHSLKTYYNITAAWGNYAASKSLTLPLTNWKGYKYLFLYIRGDASEYDSSTAIEIDLYSGNHTTNEVWYYSDKTLVNTKYYKQVKLRLASTNNGGNFMDVDWDGDEFGNQFVMSNFRQITVMGTAGAVAQGKGYFWIDNIFITSNDTFASAEMTSPEHNTGLSKNTTVKIKIGSDMTNIVCQLVDASNNYFKYEISDSNMNYENDTLTINFTNLKTGRNIIAVDAVNKLTGVPLNQFEKDLYVSDYYVIDNFESSDLTEFSTSAFEGSTVAVLDTGIYNTVYSGNKSLKLDYSTSAAWKSGGIRFTFDEAMDFSDFSVLRLYVKGNFANTGRINVAFYDNDNNKLDLNYNEDDYCAWTGSDEVSKNFWVRIDIPLNSGSFVDGNTPANNSGYQSGNQQVEFNKIESLDIYFDSPYSGCSGTLYIDDIILLKYGYEFVSAASNASSAESSTGVNIEVKDFKPVYNLNSGEYSVDVSAPANSDINYKIIGLNGDIIFSGSADSVSGEVILKWNGEHSGKQVNAGIYFIKLEIENKDSNIKKTIIKRFYLVR